MRVLKSPYVFIREGKRHSSIYHSLYGNAVKADRDVVDLLNRLSLPVELAELVDYGRDAIEALKDLIRLGFVVGESMANERENWKREVQEEYRKIRLFSEGIVLVLTDQCNFSCKYCIGKHTLPAVGRMSFSTAKKAIDAYLSQRKQDEDGIRHTVITFTGGEPLLEWDVVEAVSEYAAAAYNAIGIDFRLITNASLVSGKIAETLHTRGFHIVVSLDGDSATHDASRKYPDGSPTWHDTWEGLNTLLQAGCTCSISMVYDSAHTHGLNTGIIKSLSLIGVKDISLNINNVETFAKKPEEIAEFFLDLRFKAKQYGIDVGGMWATPAIDIRSGSIHRNRWAFCSAASKVAMFVLPDGSIPYCDYYPRILGHLDSLEKLWADQQLAQNNYLYGQWPECQGCEIEGFCSPCLLEKELLHSESSRYQHQKCELIRECTRHLVLEEDPRS